MTPFIVETTTKIQSLIVRLLRSTWGPFGFLNMWLKKRFDDKPLAERLYQNVVIRPREKW